MKALLKKAVGEHTLHYEEVPEPVTGDDEVKIKVHATGICGSDIHIMKDEYPSKPPVIMGHEYSGTVHEIGRNVTALKKGDKVVSITAIVSCGKCRYCREGLLILCDKRLSIGSGVNGAFAEYLTVPAKYVYKIPANVTMDEAALMEPLACVVRGVIERSSVRAGDYVYVSGPGIIGQLTAQVAAACGGNVIVAGTASDIKRLELAQKCGAIATITVDTEDVLELIRRLTQGRGVDVAFECAGAERSADNCLNVLKKTGIFGQVGLYGKKIVFDMDLALMKEVRITNSYASEPTSWERALDLLSHKQINLNPLIGDKFQLKDWKTAFEKVENKEGFKVFLTPE